MWTNRSLRFQPLGNQGYKYENEHLYFNTFIFSNNVRLKREGCRDRGVGGRDRRVGVLKFTFQVQTLCLEGV